MDFVKAHLNSKILVFLSTCKQVIFFVVEAFKKWRPGISLKCLHGRMKQERRINIYSQLCEQRFVLVSTDVAARGLDFNKVVDWVVQVDCPEDVASYIHRLGLIYKANMKRIQPMYGLLSALLVKHFELQELVVKAFIRYMQCIHIQKEKDAFDVLQLPIDEFAASMGLALTPNIRFVN
ncbi:unnamed protein product [Linum trigynum]|uniref:ATP-dependent RNA helicase n=1 Tax=Linum trigynum TaxID=586398 RepID=A0AAV2CCW5_9ROSI